MLSCCGFPNGYRVQGFGIRVFEETQGLRSGRGLVLGPINSAYTLQTPDPKPTPYTTP